MEYLVIMIIIVTNNDDFSPEVGANIFSLMFFQWVNDIIVKGYQRPLTSDGTNARVGVKREGEGLSWVDNEGAGKGYDSNSEEGSLRESG